MTISARTRAHTQPNRKTSFLPLTEPSILTRSDSWGHPYLPPLPLCVRMEEADHFYTSWLSTEYEYLPALWGGAEQGGTRGDGPFDRNRRHFLRLCCSRLFYFLRGLAVQNTNDTAAVSSLHQRDTAKPNLEPPAQNGPFFLYHTDAEEERISRASGGLCVGPVVRVQTERRLLSPWF